MLIAGLGEHALIARIRQRLSPAPAWLLVDIGDDAAVYEPARRVLEAITTDACVDGVHFDRRFTPPEAIGRKALAVNLSDLAAMGAEPRLATLSLALPADLPLNDFDGIVDGLLGLADQAHIRLVGGNITRTRGPLVIDITAVGSVSRRRVLTRGGARPGDYVFVSGSLGDARAGLARLKRDPSEGTGQASHLVARYLQPEPRLRLGLQLGRRSAATAAIDLSDGLADGLVRIGEASSAGIEIDAAALPIHPDARAEWLAHGLDPLNEAVAGGDDYELLFTVSPRRIGRLRGVQSLLGGLGVTRIGRVTRGREFSIIHSDGRRQAVTGGYEHFPS